MNKAQYKYNNSKFTDMKKALEIIKENLEATLEGFKDAYETEGYDLWNEKHCVEMALKQVNLLLLQNFSNSICDEVFERASKIDVDNDIDYGQYPI